MSADPGAPTRPLTPALKARAPDPWYDPAYRQTHLATGSFKVAHGQIEAHRPPGAESGASPPLPQRIAGAVLDFLVPSVRAASEGALNNFFGTDAGASTTTGTGNSFFGGSAGEVNTTGSGNSFFGLAAGFVNTEGDENSFFGTEAGFSNSDGNRNSFFGRSAGLGNTTGSDNAFFGRWAGRENTTGSDNAFFGRAAGISNTEGFDNSFFGTGAGISNIDGSNNAIFGFLAGLSNTTESNNTLIGGMSDVFGGITNATALRHRAKATQSDSLVLGSINGVNGASADTDVGIGISAPAAPLHVRRFNNSAQVRVEDTGDSGDRHMGPMAEDFYATFGLGPDDRHIAPNDLAGVALAAAKALKADNERLKAKIREFEEIKVRLADLEAKLSTRN